MRLGSWVRSRALGAGALAVLAWTGAAADATPAGGFQEPPISTADRSERVESEIKLDVPAGREETVWEYLRTRYGDPNLYLAEQREGFAADFSTEVFLDQYFDTADLRLLRGGNGLRHRARWIPGDPDDPKHDRRLVQLKLDRGDERGIDRGEVKFPVHVPELDARRSVAHTPIGLVDRGSRREFRTALEELGVQPEHLFNTLTLHQNRRRVSIDLDSEPFATITLDEVSSRKWWKTVRFSEVELELSEIRYTAAGPEEREWMRQINELMKRDLLAAFPDLVQDQTPKYNKTFDRLSEEFAFFSLAVRYDLPLEAVFAALALAVVVGGGAVAIGRFRRGGES